MSRYVGVDGCSGGWVAVSYTPGEELDTRLHADFAAVVDSSPAAERLLVDIPIGLPETGRRRCDEDARARLGTRASTVFFAPCRGVLTVSDHETASALNRERTGYGLSIQAWHLVPKIAAVDAVLQSSDRARECVVEAHPELCFAAIGDGPLEASKTTETGRAARLDRLRPWLAEVDDVYEACLERTLRKEVQRDDVLDAMVLALSASRPLTRVPDVPREAVPRDATGLPMEIQFPQNTSFSNVFSD